MTGPGKDASAREIWERSQQLLRDHDVDGFADLFAVDGVMEFPFAPPGVPRRMEGREEIRRALTPAWRMARGSSRTTGYSSVVMHETIDPRIVAVEFDLDREVIATGEPYRISYVHVLKVHDGEIVSLRDYWTPQAAPRALAQALQALGATATTP